MMLSSHRYSIECLISFLEMQQFQKWVIDAISHLDMEQDNEILQRINVVDIHADIPQSEFIECVTVDMTDSDDVLCNAKLSALYLYEKYIKVGSELEINISSTIRKEMRNILGDKEKLMNHVNVNLNDLLLLFDKLITEMRLLLTYSHTRFKQKPEYAKIIQIFAKIKTSDVHPVDI